MLGGLDSIDWDSLQDAYGSARNVPDHLRALLSNDDAIRAKALDQLFSTVYHQGTIYSASAHVVPFLVELLEAPEVQDKPCILLLLAGIAGGRGYYEVHDPRVQRSEEMKVVAAVRRTAAPHIPALLSHLVHPEPEVRIAVAEALPFYPEHNALSSETLQRARDSESNPEVLDVFSEVLTQLH